MDDATAGLACRRCGYDLTGTAVEGVCPECSHPATASIEAARKERREAFLRLRGAVRNFGLFGLGATVVSCASETIQVWWEPFSLKTGMITTAGILGLGLWLLAAVLGVAMLANLIRLVRARTTGRWPALAPAVARLRKALWMLVVLVAVLVAGAGAAAQWSPAIDIVGLATIAYALYLALAEIGMLEAIAGVDGRPLWARPMMRPLSYLTFSVALSSGILQLLATGFEDSAGHRKFVLPISDATMAAAEVASIVSRTCAEAVVSVAAIRLARGLVDPSQWT